MFISYRRNDLHGQASALVGRIYDRLADHYGDDNVFMDLQTIPPGVDFREHLSAAVKNADVLVTIVGPHWVEIFQEKLLQDDDFVRIELETALQRSIPVIPLLVGDASMPRTVDLPEKLQGFAHRNAFHIDSGRDFDANLEQLMAEIDRHFGDDADPSSKAGLAHPSRIRTRSFVATLALAGVLVVVAALGVWSWLGSNKRQFEPGENVTTTQGLEMVWCEPGSFIMGQEDENADEDETRHKVTLSRGFWIGKFEVTQQLWETVMGDNPSWFRESGPEAPVDSVSWDQAMDFCRKLTELEREHGRLPGGWKFTLPTEAQWEYACRAGSEGDYNFPASIVELGWFDLISEEKTHPVGGKVPNKWGIYDMHGNVYEWCRDWYEAYPSEHVTDPVGPKTGFNRVYRGGSWHSDRLSCRSANRYHDGPYKQYKTLGFRVALTEE